MRPNGYKSAAGDHADARANLRSLARSGSSAPAQSSAPIRPVGCICGLGVRPARPPARPALDCRLTRGHEEGPAAAPRSGAGRPRGAAASAELWPAGLDGPHAARSRSATAPHHLLVPARLTDTNQLQAILPAPAQTFVPLSTTISVRPHGGRFCPACRLHLWVRRQARTALPLARPRRPPPRAATGSAGRRRRDPGRGGLRVPPPQRRSGQQGPSRCSGRDLHPRRPHTNASCLHA